MGQQDPGKINFIKMCFVVKVLFAREFVALDSFVLKQAKIIGSE